MFGENIWPLQKEFDATYHAYSVFFQPLQIQQLHCSALESHSFSFHEIFGDMLENERI